MSVISVEQVKFKYQNSKTNAVDGVSFCIEKGSIIFSKRAEGTDLHAYSGQAYALFYHVCRHVTV